MVTEPRPLFSDTPPELPHKVGLGDRFRYFRGHSGRRYIFTRIASRDLVSFDEAVILSAEDIGGGVLAVRAVALHAGAPAAELVADSRRQNRMLLVHLLAETDAERRAIVEDLTGTPISFRPPAARQLDEDSLPLAA